MAFKDDLKEIQKKKVELKQKKSNGDFDANEEDYWLKLMDLEDDEIIIRIEMFDEEFKDAAAFSSNITEDLIQTVGSMQRYNTELAKTRKSKHKAKRYRDKLYNERYEYYRLGKGQIQLKTSKEYEVWISKDSRYVRTNSYCETYDILIKYLEEAVRQLSQKIFVLQAILKSRDKSLEVELGPSFS